MANAQRRKTRVKLATALLAIAAGAAAGVALADLKSEAPKKVDFTALWKINAEHSDDPQKILTKRRDDADNGGAYGGGPSTGRRGGGASGGIDAGDIFGGVISGTIDKGGIHPGTGGSAPDRPAGDPAASSTMRVPLDSFLATREQFEVEQKPEAFTIRTVDETSTCKPGEPSKVPLQSGEMVEQRCGWKGDAFVVELVSEDGVTRANRYELRRGDRQLVMTSEIKGGHGKLRGLQIKRVYDRALSRSDARRRRGYSCVRYRASRCETLFCHSAVVSRKPENLSPLGAPFSFVCFAISMARKR